MNKARRVMKNMVNKKIAFMGAGNMAEALINGFIKSSLVPCRNICASDINTKRLSYIKKKFKIGIKDSVDAVKSSDIIFLAVKPKDVGTLLEQIKDQITSHKLIISIAAGITTKYIEKVLGKKAAVIRTMPNTPALVGAGAISVCGGRYAGKKDIETAVKLFSSSGTVVVLKESKIDAVTAVSGSGPAYVFYLAQAMEQAGVNIGLPKDIARKLTYKTIFGAGKMLTELSDDAENLRKKVTSPGGTTEAAINSMSKDKFLDIVIEAVKKAEKKAKELSKR